MFQQLARPREQGRVLVSFVFNWPFHFYCERVAWKGSDEAALASTCVLQGHKVCCEQTLLLLVKFDRTGKRNL